MCSTTFEPPPRRPGEGRVKSTPVLPDLFRPAVSIETRPGYFLRKEDLAPLKKRLKRTKLWEGVGGLDLNFFRSEG